jgi:hypothetical protein
MAKAPLSSPPFPVTEYGNVDLIKTKLDPVFIHVPGKRLGQTCRAHRIPCVPALTGWNRYSRPEIDGVVIYKKDKRKLSEALSKKRTLTPAQRQEQKLKRDARISQRFAQLIEEKFPSMPPDEVKACAQHACQSGSGRVGRSKVVDDPVLKAVIAHARHRFTPYDLQLRARVDRDSARNQAHRSIHRLIDAWAEPQNKAAVAAVVEELEKQRDEISEALGANDQSDSDF